MQRMMKKVETTQQLIKLNFVAPSGKYRNQTLYGPSTNHVFPSLFPGYQNASGRGGFIRNMLATSPSLHDLTGLCPQPSIRTATRSHSTAFILYLPLGSHVQ